MANCIRTAAVLLLALAPLCGDEWVAPATASAVANPLTASPATLDTGKEVYGKNCLICHGAAGQGDGPGAAYLNPKPAQLSASKIQQQSDGALFWKISTGRGLMLGWAAAIKEDERWALVNFLRTFAAKP